MSSVAKNGGKTCLSLTQPAQRAGAVQLKQAMLKTFENAAAWCVRDPAYRFNECPHTLADVKATAIVLRVLTKERWDSEDLALVDALWRQATVTRLFGEDYEGERHRIERS